MSSLQRKIKSRNTAVKTREKTYENLNKTNEEDIIATIEVTEKTFEKLCSLNSEKKNLLKMQKIMNKYMITVNITKKINTLKSLVHKEKGLIKKVSDSKPESFKSKFVNLPKLTIEKFKRYYTKFNTFMNSFVAAIDSCQLFGR